MNIGKMRCIFKYGLIYPIAAISWQIVFPESESESNNGGCVFLLES